MPVTTFCKNCRSRIIRENVKVNSAFNQVQNCLINLHLLQLFIHALFSADFRSCNFIKLITTLGVNFVKFGCCLLVRLLLLVLAYRIVGFSRQGSIFVVIPSTILRSISSSSSSKASSLIMPIPFSTKLTFVYKCIYALLYCFKLWLVDPIGAFLGNC